MYPDGLAGISVKFVALPDSTSLRVIESGPRDAPVVFCVHGWAASVYTFSETIPALVQAGYRVVALDLPGHGLSDKSLKRGRYATSAMVDAVRAVASALGITRCRLVAHSMGCAIALQVALSGTPTVERLVLVGAVGLGRAPLAAVGRFLSPAFLAPLLPVLLGRPAIRLLLALAFGTAARPTERDIEEYGAPTQYDEFALACRACLHEGTWDRLSEGRLRALTMPVLVVAGGRDRIVLDSAAGGRLIPGARVLEIPAGGHLVIQECAEECNGALISFLSTSPRS